MNLLNRTWATGAMPIGAPGCPELALKVASTCVNWFKMYQYNVAAALDSESTEKQRYAWEASALSGALTASRRIVLMASVSSSVYPMTADVKRCRRWRLCCRSN